MNVSEVQTELHQPITDTRLYRLIKLENGLEVLLVSDVESSVCSASLCVNAGSFNDPPELPGLAHFCEHMLFLGTKRFPKENAFHEIVRLNSGKYNAYTLGEYTNFYFEVSIGAFGDCLDRFAEFFKTPLFNKGSKERELFAVDSEHQSFVSDETRILFQAIRNLADPTHPASRFSTGNISTLMVSPEARRVKVVNEVVDFYKKNYSAHKMKLVLISNLSLNNLQRLALQHFGDVKNSSGKSFSSPVPRMSPFPSLKWGKLMLVNQAASVESESPSSDSETATAVVRVIFRTPYFTPEKYAERAFIHRFWAHLLGHESRGSLYHLLSWSKLITSLTASPLTVSSGSDLLSLDLRLTRKGAKSFRFILAALQVYLQTLRDGPADELARLSKEFFYQSLYNFMYQDKNDSAMEEAAGLTRRMFLHLPDRRWLLKGGNFFPADSTTLLESAQWLSLDNAAVIVLAAPTVLQNIRQNVYGTEDCPGTTAHDQFYNFAYSLYSLPDLSCNSAGSAGCPIAREDFSFPQPNPFLPKQIDWAQGSKVSGDPRLACNAGNVQLWYKNISSHISCNRAQATVELAFPHTSGMPNASDLEPLMALQVYCRIVRWLLKDELYYAELVNCQYDVQLSPRETGAIELSFSGFVPNVAPVLQRIVATVRSVLQDSVRQFQEYQRVFAVAKAELISEYEQFRASNVAVVSMAALTYLLEDGVYSIEDRLATLRGLRMSEMINTVAALLHHTVVVGLISGDVAEEECRTLEPLLRTLVADTGELPWTEPGSVLLRHSESHVLEVQATVANPGTSALVVYFQTGLRADPRAAVLTEVLSYLLELSVGTELRTKRQLAYVVLQHVKQSRETLGLEFVIVSTKNLDYLDYMLDRYLLWFGQQLQSMTEAELKEKLAALAATRREEHRSVRAGHERLWQEISGRTLAFAVQTGGRLESTPFATVEKKELVDFFKKVLSPAGVSGGGVPRSKLCVYGTSGPAGGAAPTASGGQASRPAVGPIETFLRSKGLYVPREKLEAIVAASSDSEGQLSESKMMWQITKYLVSHGKSARVVQTVLKEVVAQVAARQKHTAADFGSAVGVDAPEWVSGAGIEDVPQWRAERQPKSRVSGYATRIEREDELIGAVGVALQI